MTKREREVVVEALAFVAIAELAMENKDDPNEVRRVAMAFLALSNAAVDYVKAKKRKKQRLSLKRANATIKLS